MIQKSTASPAGVGFMEGSTEYPLQGSGGAGPSEGIRRGGRRGTDQEDPGGEKRALSRGGGLLPLHQVHRELSILQ